MKLANKANPFPHGIPRTYAELVAVFAPRVIHDRIEFENASAVMNALAGHALNKEQEDYLETLAVLVDEYDRGHNTQPENPRRSPCCIFLWKSMISAIATWGASSGIRPLADLF